MHTSADTELHFKLPGSKTFSLLVQGSHSDLVNQEGKQLIVNLL